jgi:hypothetical protein
MNKKKLFLACALITYLAVAWFMDPFLLLLIAVGLAWLLVPWVLVAAVMFLVAVTKKRSRVPALRMLRFALLTILLMALGWALNHVSAVSAVADAKAYPGKVAPYLDEYRIEHGVYPNSLDQLPRKPWLPRLLRWSHAYRSGGGSYSFTFAKPGGLIDCWDYDSKTGAWVLSD